MVTGSLRIFGGAFFIVRTGLIEQDNRNSVLLRIILIIQKLEAVSFKNSLEFSGLIIIIKNVFDAFICN